MEQLVVNVACVVPKAPGCMARRDSVRRCAQEVGPGGYLKAQAIERLLGLCG